MGADPSASWDRPTGSAWERAANQSIESWARLTGAVMGLVVAAVSVAVAELFPVGESTIPPGWTLAPAILVAGGLGGWLIAPLAWRARSPGGWVVAITLLALTAVVLGDAVVVASMAAASSARDASGSGESPALASLPALVPLFVIGLIVVGPFAAVATVPAAAVWAVGMRVVRGRLS